MNMHRIMFLALPLLLATTFTACDSEGSGATSPSDSTSNSTTTPAPKPCTGYVCTWEGIVDTSDSYDEQNRPLIVYANFRFKFAADSTVVIKGWETVYRSGGLVGLTNQPEVTGTWSLRGDSILITSSKGPWQLTDVVLVNGKSLSFTLFDMRMVLKPAS
jgi:hypothetical protein